MESTLGFFQRLPEEVIGMVLDYLSVMETSVLSLVSKDISSCITRYLSTRTWRNRMMVQKLHQSFMSETCVLNHYRAIGLLLRRCTVSLPAKERLHFVFSAFSEILCFTMEGCSKPRCLGLVSYRELLKTLTTGWDDLQRHQVFNTLCDFTYLPCKIEVVVTGIPGASEELELAIRHFCRKVLLNLWQNQRETLFWLTCLLKPQCTVSRARLLFIVFGPLLQGGKLGWLEVRERVVPSYCLSDLAKVLVILCESQEWSDDDILGIITEMTEVPQAWHIKNTARLLLLCGDHICFTIINHKISKQLLDSTHLLVFLSLVCKEDWYPTNWLTKIFRQLLEGFRTATEKQAFVSSVENTFSDMSVELQEVTVAGNLDGDNDTLENLLEAREELSQGCPNFFQRGPDLVR